MLRNNLVACRIVLPKILVKAQFHRHFSPVWKWLFMSFNLIGMLQENRISIFLFIFSVFSHNDWKCLCSGANYSFWRPGKNTKYKMKRDGWQELGGGGARQSECDWYECHIVPGECEGESLRSQRKQGRVSFWTRRICFEVCFQLSWLSHFLGVTFGI